MKGYGKAGCLAVAFYPILFGILPVIILYTSNFYNINLALTYRAVLITLGTAMAFFFLLRLFLRDWHLAGFILSVFFFFFYNFRSIVLVFTRIYQYYGFLGFQIAAASTACGMALVILVQSKMKIKAKAFTPIFNVMALFLVAYNLCFVGTRSVQAALLTPEKPAAADSAISKIVSEPLPASEEKPDIYYIILDSYDRADVLQELYGQDNHPFIQYLNAKGFYIADQSHSNYAQTLLSVSSSLNMQYLDNLLALDPELDDRRPLGDLLQQSAVPTIFKNQDYTVYAFESGFGIDIFSSDVFIPSEPRFNAFEQELIVNSVAFPFEKDIRVLYYPRQTLNRLDQLEALVNVKGPKFVYAHLLLTHPPFVFDRDGNLRAKDAYWGDGISFDGTQEEYITGYTEQVLYANRRMIQLIDQILAHPEHQSIIILQGDHGSGLDLNNFSDETCYRERFSILNAYYLPGEGKKMLYPQITPVNTFRVILNEYFHANLPLAPDRSYFSSWDKPFKFSEVAKDQLNQPCVEE